MAPHDVNAQTAVDMANARKQTSFNVEVVRDYLHGGRAEWDLREKILQVILNEPTFGKKDRYYKSRGESYDRILFMTNRMHELKEVHGWSEREEQIAMSLLDEHLAIHLHYIAFEPVVRTQGSPYILEKYGNLIAKGGILGCYLQTELGHGTNVNRLETTATYIPETQEIEIHSPTLASTKWWSGGAGKTATHAVVQAKLILGGKDIGPHLFFVQLRDFDTYKTLPGIHVGDIGPKSMGGLAADNGFARFDHVRIHKRQMLSKFAQITDDGKYVKPKHDKLSYGGMLSIRAGMVTTGAWLIAKAATISIRYATVRRQGEVGKDGLERQVLTYPPVFHRLLPILSHAYVFFSLGRDLSKAFENMTQRLAQNDMSLISEIHAMTSGLKVLVTTTGIQDLEIARRAMGGHGYSAFSALGKLYAEYVPSATYEGDNFVLDQQTVRGALKSLKNLQASKNPSTTLSPSSIYLRLLLDPVASNSHSLQFNDSTWTSVESVALLLEWRAALMVQEAARNVEEPDANVNNRVAKAVAEAFVASQIVSFVKNLQMGTVEAKVVTDLYRLYLLTTVEASVTDLLSFGVSLSGSSGGKDETRGLRLAIKKLCTELIPHAIGLTDAFGFTDWELDSALGVHDGKVYEALWERALANPLNQKDVPDSYPVFIKPVLDRGRRLAGVAKL
jgi:acyl-CoA oxidase